MSDIDLGEESRPAFNKGDRVRLNERGRARSPGFNGRTGVVAYQPLGVSYEVAVLWHGNKKPTYYEIKLIELALEVK